MEETPAKQGYIVTSLYGIYHLVQPRTHGLSLCGLVSILTEPEHRRRYQDWRVVTEKPTGQFTALCSECERRARAGNIQNQKIAPDQN